MQRLHIAGDDMKRDMRILPGDPMDDGRNKARTLNVAASDSYFSSGAIGEKLDVLTVWRSSSNTAAPPSSRTRPYSVSSTPWGLRSSNRTPMVRSNSAMDLEMAG